MLKSNRDPTSNAIQVIIEKPTYAGDEMYSSSDKYFQVFL